MKPSESKDALSSATDWDGWKEADMSVRYWRCVYSACDGPTVLHHSCCLAEGPRLRIACVVSPEPSAIQRKGYFNAFAASRPECEHRALQRGACEGKWNLAVVMTRREVWVCVFPRVSAREPMSPVFPAQLALFFCRAGSSACSTEHLWSELVLSLTVSSPRFRPHRESSLSLFSSSPASLEMTPVWPTALDALL